MNNTTGRSRPALPHPNRRGFLLGSMGALVGTGIIAAPGAIAQAASGTDTLYVGMARDFATFDPAVAVTSTNIATNLLVFERLYETSFADRQTRPMLALGDPERVSDTLYRVAYRTDSVFHTGRSVTGDDVVFSINRLVDEENSYFYRQFIPFIKEARLIEEGLIELELTYPTDILKDRLAVVGIVPKELVEADPEAFGAAPVGSGPFRFVSAAANDRVVLERFNEYIGETPGLVNSIELRIIMDSSSRAIALTTGEVSLIEEPSDLDLLNLEASPEIETAFRPGFLASFIMFNCSKAPFDDKRVRQALMYAIDREELVDVALFGNGNVAKALIPEHHPSYREPETVYTYDPERARSLLAEAGYPEGLVLDGRQLMAQVFTTVWNEAAANLIISKWRDIGIDFSQNVGGEAIYSNVVDGSYDVLIALTDQSYFGWDGPLLYGWFHGPFWSEQLNHFEGEAAERLHELLTESLRAGVDRPAILAEMQSIILEEMPMSILFHRAVPTAWRPDEIEGVAPLETASLDVRLVAKK
ncbi:ABC transporter substrate-binding protein [Celeribacter sp.]|uniref:ABC transporter substrate-binding protein n=1 Tax=Celeribacter sp. TaxID=1890673 RepID=UPI003A950C16